MTKLPPTSQKAIAMVELFRDHLMYIKLVRYTYEHLFEDAVTIEAENKTAPDFFAFLQGILTNTILLAFAKISDPMRAGKSGPENFSFANLIESIDWPENTLKKLKATNASVTKFREQIVGARNKLLSHNDKETYLQGTILGAFAEGDDTKYIKTLEHACNTMAESATGSIFGELVPNSSGDVADLVRYLHYAIAFDGLFHRHKGDLFSALATELDDVRRSLAVAAGEDQTKRQTSEAV